MNFRFKAFAVHLGGSAAALTLVLGALWIGWYHWPGWYLTQVAHVVAVMIGVDVVLGPSLTGVVANPKKSRRELTRDIGVIVVCQLVALAYGTLTLWQGRPLYYAFSVDRMQLVQASDISSGEAARARRERPDLAPHWYSLPRWVWAPLPADKDAADKIMKDAVFGTGDDVIQMPRYFRPWSEAANEIRKNLTDPAAKGMYAKKEVVRLRERIKALGIKAEASTLILTGRSRPVLVVFDPATLAIRAYLSVD